MTLCSAAPICAVPIRAPGQRHMEVLMCLGGADLKGYGGLRVEGILCEEVGVCQVAQLHVGRHIKRQPAHPRHALSKIPSRASGGDAGRTSCA